MWRCMSFSRIILCMRAHRENLLNQTENRLYLSFSNWFGFRKKNSVVFCWFISRIKKMMIIYISQNSPKIVLQKYTFLGLEKRTALLLVHFEHKKNNDVYQNSFTTIHIFGFLGLEKRSAFYVGSFRV